jgi:hypothetical protein
MEGAEVSIEQHAEAAKSEMSATYLREALSGKVLRPIQVREQETVPIIAKHMQAAIDEATASLRARIAVLEGLGPLIGRYGSARFAMGATLSDDRWEGNAKRAEEIITEIDAILTGGAP